MLGAYVAKDKGDYRHWPIKIWTVLRAMYLVTERACTLHQQAAAAEAKVEFKTMQHWITENLLPRYPARVDEAMLALNELLIKLQQEGVKICQLAALLKAEDLVQCLSAAKVEDDALTKNEQQLGRMSRNHLDKRIQVFSIYLLKVQSQANVTMCV